MKRPRSVEVCTTVFPTLCIFLLVSAISLRLIVYDTQVRDIIITLMSLSRSETTRNSHPSPMDPLALWLRDRGLTYNLRVCNNSCPEISTVIHLRPDSMIQVTWNDAEYTTPPHGQWLRNQESTLSLKYSENGELLPEQDFMEFKLLRGTSVYMQVGSEAALLLMPYTQGELVGPIFSAVHRTKS